MSNRIDLTQFIALADEMAAAHDKMGLEGMGTHHVEAHSALLEAIAELKRCYEKFDNLKRLVTWNHTDSDNIANDDGLLVVLTELLTSE
jgi:lipoprotein NlpI